MIDEREALRRAIVLLRAAYELMRQQEESPYVLNILEQTAVWDDVECDGYCLNDEIKDLHYCFWCGTRLEVEE